MATPSPLSEHLAAGIAEAQAKWPGVELDAERFASWVAGRLGESDDLEAALASLNLADLYLACACADGMRRAVETFDRKLLGQVGAFISRYGSGRDFVDEVAQRLRVKLLVGSESGPARIAQYSGRGTLESWVCAAAIRMAIDLTRAAGNNEVIDVAEIALADTPDPVKDHLRAQYADEFRAATAQSMASLSARERNLLRFYYIERLTLEKLGAIHRVHAVTVMRWLADARAKILDETRRLLRERLQISESQLASLVPMLRSDLDLSIHRLLGP